jgi:UDPglucose--hexose-1-phosphate uridylyltransferase
MSELRFNRITGDWVIIATERAHPPEDFVVQRDTIDPPARVEDCPFCPGNEGRSETLASREHHGRWSVRMVRNKFPALAPDGDRRKSGTPMRRSMTGFGHHDVVIEHPEHNRWLWRQDVGGICDVLGIIRERYRELAADPRIELAVPFKNHGRSAGTSILHPHTQIVGTPIMPADVRRRLWDSIRYYDEHSQCVFCAVIDDECEFGERVIHKTKGFVSFIPYAALSPFHILMFPNQHSPDYGTLSDSHLSDLADHLKGVLGRIELSLLGPDFNLVIRSVFGDRTDPRSYHWYISIVPHVSRVAGFEMGSGMFINPSIPEDVAKFLRSAV